MSIRGIQKTIFINKFGHQPAQDTVEQTVWTGTPGIMAYPPAPTTMFVSSTISLDCTTGAKVGMLFGLDSGYNLISERVVFSGHLPVETANAYARVHRFVVTSAGTNGKNHGQIHIGQGSLTNGTPNSKYLHVASGTNQSEHGAYTIPASYTGRIREVHFSCGGNDIIQCRLYARPQNETFQLKDKFEIYRNQVDRSFIDKSYPSKTDIELRGIRLTAGGDVEVSGGFGVELTYNGAT